MAGIINLRLRILGIMGIGLAALVLSACTAEAEVEPFPKHVDPDTGIEYVAVDRFSDDAGTILRRSDNPELPAPNEPIDYDADFLNHALGPDGDDVQYYGFDVASFRSATLYSFLYASDPIERVPGQSAVFDVIPGDDGYNDVWQMTRVLGPDDYEPDSV